MPPDAAYNGAIHLTAVDLSIASALVLIAGVVSLLLRLGLEKRLLVAGIRTVVQLLIIGFVLRKVFQISSLWAIGLVVLFMIGAASRAAVQRSSRTFHGVVWRSFFTLLLSGLTTTVMVTGVIVGVKPWYEAQYLIPLLGMVLGNGLTGISLCLDHLLESLSERKGEVEMHLALGATRWEAAREPVSDAVRRGMIPIINSMMVVGIVSLPGMMTGQILQGADPLNAVRYQIVVMFMLAASTSMGCILTALLVYKGLFNDRHQLRSERIQKRKG